MFDTLFKDTYIYKKPTVNKNNYYVLKFDFSGVTFDETDSNILLKNFKESLYDGINRFLSHYDLSFTIDTTLYPAELLRRFLSYYESLKLDKKIYIIIDEYDNFTNAILEGNATSFKSILGNEGFIKPFYAVIKAKSGTVVDRVFITGVCSISLDSMTSGFNIATNITNHISFNAMTALTHDEVRLLIKEVDEENREEIFNTMLVNYDGYKFNKKVNELVFNPTLVMYYLSNYYTKKEEPEELFDKNIISSFEQIRNIITLKNNQKYIPILKELLESKTTNGILMSNFDTIKEVEEDMITSLLYYFGYITIDGAYDPAINSLKYTIPNKVIDRIFNGYLIAILKEEDNIEFDNKIVMECEKEMITTGSIEKLSKYIEEVLKSGGNRLLEKFDKKYVQLLYYAILSPRNTYNTYMEYPTNDRYIDLILFKNRSDVKYDILVEFKYLKKKEYSNRNLESKRIDAREQINEYVLDDRIDKTNLKKYVIIFVGNELKLLEEVI